MRVKHPHLHSFAPLVVLLKMMLSQQGLDKPFTGGLGSYRLYVLVSHHVSQVLEQQHWNCVQCFLFELISKVLCGTAGKTYCNGRQRRAW